MTEKTKETFGIVIRCAVAMALFAVAIIKYDALSGLDIEGILSSLDNTALIVLVTLLMYFVKALVFVLPASVLYLAVGVILPLGPAIVTNVAGIALEVSVTYLLGRFLGKDYVNKLLSKKKAGRKLLEKNYQNKKAVIFITRLLPVFPIDFVSLLYGASGSNFVLYFILSVLGIAPRVILFAIIGDNIFKLIPMDKLIFIAICCIPIGVAAYLIKKLVYDKRKAKDEKRNTE